MTQLFADDAQHGTCAVLLVVAAQGDGLAGLGCQFQGDVLLLQQFQQSLHVDVEDSRYGLVRDGREGHDLCETSQELRTEVALHDVHQLVVLRHLTAVEFRHDVLGADIRGEQDQRVGEVTHTAQTVVQLAFVQNL